MTTELECRICLSNCIDARGGALFSPCACSGSMALVHPECLQQWREVGGREAASRCEQCLEPYVFDPNWSPWFTLSWDALRRVARAVGVAWFWALVLTCFLVMTSTGTGRRFDDRPDERVIVELWWNESSLVVSPLPSELTLADPWVMAMLYAWSLFAMSLWYAAAFGWVVAIASDTDDAGEMVSSITYWLACLFCVHTVVSQSTVTAVISAVCGVLTRYYRFALSSRSRPVLARPRGSAADSE